MPSNGIVEYNDRSIEEQNDIGTFSPNIEAPSSIHGSVVLAWRNFCAMSSRISTLLLGSAEEAQVSMHLILLRLISIAFLFESSHMGEFLSHVCIRYYQCERIFYLGAAHKRFIA